MALIKQTLPYQLSEIDAIEGWLDDLASQGLLLENIDTYFFFRETEPQTVRHRIDVHRKEKTVDEERRDYFLQCGWTYIGSINKNFDIYRAVQSDAVELHTNEEMLRCVLERTLRSHLWTAIVCLIILVAWLLYLFFSRSIYRHGLLEHLLTSSVLDLFPLLLWSVVLAYDAALELVTYFQAKRRLLLRRTYHTRARAKQRIRQHRVRVAIHVVLIMVYGLKLILSSYGDDYEHVLLDDPYCAPYTTETLLPQDAKDRNPDYIYAAQAWDYPLLRQTGFFQRTLSGDHEVEIYEVKNTALAATLAKNMAKYHGAEEISLSGWEQAWFCHGETHFPILYHKGENTTPAQILLLRQGSQVILLAYSGNGDLLGALKH